MRLEKRSDGGGAEDLPQEPKGGKQKPVFIYIVILFAVAFALILVSFIMHQRSNQQVLGELHNHVNALEELQDALDENLRLEKELETSQKAVEDLENELAGSGDSIAALQDQQTALLSLYALMQQHSAGDYDACQKTIDQMERDGAAALLSDLDAPGVTSPAQRYRQLKDAVEAEKGSHD